MGEGAFERFSVMKYAVISLTLAGLALGGCTGPIIMGTDAAIIMATRPGSPPSADTQSQIPEHESWCYSTLGDPQCYAHAQDISPGRLINVEPQNRYPVTVQAYRDEIAGRNAPQPSGAAEPIALGSAASAPVEHGALANEGGGGKAP